MEEEFISSMRKPRKNLDNHLVRWLTALYHISSRSIVLETKEDVARGKNFHRCIVSVLVEYVQ